MGQGHARIHPRNLKILPKKGNFGIFWGLDPPRLGQYFTILVGPHLVKMSGSAHEGHSRVIILSNYDGLELLMLHTDFHENRPAGSGEEEISL